MPFQDPEERRRYHAVRRRHMRDALALLEVMVYWRESPRSSAAHKQGRSALSAAYAEIKLGWQREGVPFPKLSDRAKALMNSATIMGNGERDG